MREAINAILYLLRTGCPWRNFLAMISAAFDHLHYFSQLPESWLWEAIWERLHMDWRKDIGREMSASAAIIDSQSSKSAEKWGGHDGLIGYDAVKK